MTETALVIDPNDRDPGDELGPSRRSPTNEKSVGETISPASALGAVDHPAQPPEVAEDARRDEDQEPEPLTDPSHVWTVVASVAGIVLLGTCIGSAWYAVRSLDSAGNFARPEVRPQRSQTETQRPPGGRSPTEEIQWTDAARFSQRRHPFTLRVERASYGAVRGKDHENQVIMTEDENLLAINVSVHNRGTRPHSFQPWYGHAFETERDVEIAAELTDDSGRSYTLLRFDDLSRVEGQQLFDQVDPEQQVRDTVVFLIPPDTDRKLVQYFRLALPGQAVGLDDFFRFEIPTHMIERF